MMENQNCGFGRLAFWVVFLFLASCFLPIFGFSCLYAKDITVLFTGNTHAMLYPCSCPKEPDGGVARRASLIKQIRQSEPEAILLDTGNFFAGGALDEYTQNTQLDTQRTEVNLKAIELMRYDALALGEDEFNFGEDFLKESIFKDKINLISCNVISDFVKPYYIKRVGDLKVGIIGVTSLSAKRKAQKIKLSDDLFTSVKDAISKLKDNEKTDIIILLSNLNEESEVKLLNSFKGVDLLISVNERGRKNEPVRIGDAIAVSVVWQGRHLGKVTLKMDKGKIVDYKAEDLRLSDKIKDDAAILSILPQCFSDASCRKEGFLGACINQGTLKAQCKFNKAPKISLTVIKPASCATCDTDKVIKSFKRPFPGLEVSYLDSSSSKAKRIIKDFAVKGLPAYFFAQEIEKDKAFSGLKDNLDKKGDLYMIKPQLVGFSYLPGRKRVSGKLDVFISLFDYSSPAVLDVLKDKNADIHFLAIEKNGRFEAAKGNMELEEDVRSVCVKKYCPKSFYNYISCRSKNINSSWWEDCLNDCNTDKIKTCARSEEGNALLRDNIKLNSELEIMFGPTYLLDNLEIFSTRGAPSKEELNKVIKK